MQLLTIEEMADRLRISVATARHWRNTGFGPRGTRIGRRVLYREDEVAAFIETAFTAEDKSA